MKTAWILTLKLAGLAVVVVCLRLVFDHRFSDRWEIALMWGLVALVPVLATSARWFLNRRPTPERAEVLTIPIHYLEMIFLGGAVIVAFRATQVHRIAHVPFPQSISWPLLQIFAIVATLTVLNLAISGLGLPFAAVLSKKLATTWLYRHSRNPMGLSSLLFCIVAAVWLQSLHAILWTVLWLSPAWILYVRIYEERELEVRFGESYLLYKAKTPFFL
ncbi:MAG TPA: methyltransferase [Terriglobales bacterium]|nr:methyltransferase [Terriglobales bacterium]